MNPINIFFEHKTITLVLYFFYFIYSTD